MDNKGQFLTWLFGYSVPAQFNWDQVIAQKAALNALSSLSVTPAHLVILTLFVKNCHKGVHLTEKITCMSFLSASIPNSAMMRKIFLNKTLFP